jgi:glucose-6-phosphate dehydrogenase assembly protein OpcA
VGLERLVAGGRAVVSDLNWSRLTHWRDMVAQFFDAPPARHYLDRLDRVEVEVASRRGRKTDLTEGLLLAGWLASRLGWVQEDGRRSRRGSTTFRLRSSSGVVAVEIRPARAHSGDGLHSIRLGSEGGSTFSVSRVADDERCVTVMAEMPEGGHSRVVRMDPPSEATLLSEELDAQGRDSVFEEALAEAVRFLGVSH